VIHQCNRMLKYNTVTCRPVARERPGKQARNKYTTNNRADPLLDNARNNGTGVARGVFCVFRIYPLLGNGCVFCVVVRPEAT
jgi:hypothetical protein